MKIVSVNIRSMDDVFSNIKLINDNIVLFVLEWEFLGEYGQVLEKYLTEYQKIKSQKYFSIEDRYNYTSTHAIVNIVFLIQYGEIITDKDLKYCNGRPYIGKFEELNYNISHTKKCAVVAFSKGDIGVDVENYQKQLEYYKILRKYFVFEVRKYEKIDLKLFYTLWTIKEACVKSLKSGIRDMKNIEIIQIENNVAIAKHVYNGKMFKVSIMYIDEKFVISLCCENKLSIRRSKCLNLLLKTSKKITLKCF